MEDKKPKKSAARLTVEIDLAEKMLKRHLEDMRSKSGVMSRLHKGEAGQLREKIKKLREERKKMADTVFDD